MASIPIDDERVDSDQGPGADRQDEVCDSNELIKLRTERDQLFERLARTTAEFKNSQKRMESEFDQRMQYANASLIRSLLPVIDNFERALAQDPSTADTASLLSVPFDYHPLNRMIYGAGALDRLGELVREYGGTRGLLVTDPGLEQAGHPENVLQTEDQKLARRQAIIDANVEKVPAACFFDCRVDSQERNPFCGATA